MGVPRETGAVGTGALTIGMYGSPALTGLRSAVRSFADAPPPSGADRSSVGTEAVDVVEPKPSDSGAAKLCEASAPGLGDPSVLAAPTSSGADVSCPAGGSWELAAPDDCGADEPCSGNG
ncbi:hypothetical protein CXY01_36330 [Cellulomonas xylanilytica]|uniref:Uncharacterized protein n=1 Tax=Cellulomonas xylanilytica TaxID=233583 RepID=A0A510V8A4_9CELL|nr:hypothetical protein CXY01_36330 [Cellulomonas xylanilytica]